MVLVTERMAAAFRRQYADLPPSISPWSPTGSTRRPLLAPRLGQPQTGSRSCIPGRFTTGAAWPFLEAAEQLDASITLRLLGTLDAGARGIGAIAGARWGCFDGYVDHARALAAMRSADLLLLIANTTGGAEATVPGKLFEYLASGTPILAVVPTLESSTADVLSANGAGSPAPTTERCVLLRAALDRTRLARRSITPLDGAS